MSSHFIVLLVTHVMLWYISTRHIMSHLSSCHAMFTYCDPSTFQELTEFGHPLAHHDTAWWTVVGYAHPTLSALIGIRSATTGVSPCNVPVECYVNVHVIQYPVLACYDIYHHIISCHAMIHPIMSYHVIPHFIVSCYDISHQIISYLISWCLVMIHPIMSYHVISHLIISCYDISHHVITCHISSHHVMLWYIPSRHNMSSLLSWYHVMIHPIMS